MNLVRANLTHRVSQLRAASGERRYGEKRKTRNAKEMALSIGRDRASIQAFVRFFTWLAPEKICSTPLQPSHGSLLSVIRSWIHIFLECDGRKETPYLSLSFLSILPYVDRSYRRSTSLFTLSFEIRGLFQTGQFESRGWIVRL